MLLFNNKIWASIKVHQHMDGKRKWAHVHVRTLLRYKEEWSQDINRKMDRTWNNCIDKISQTQKDNIVCFTLIDEN